MNFIIFGFILLGVYSGIVTISYFLKTRRVLVMETDEDKDNDWKIRWVK